MKNVCYMIKKWYLCRNLENKVYKTIIEMLNSTGIILNVVGRVVVEKYDSCRKNVRACI